MENIKSKTACLSSIPEHISMDTKVSTPLQMCFSITKSQSHHYESFWLPYGNTTIGNNNGFSLALTDGINTTVMDASANANTSSATLKRLRTFTPSVHTRGFTPVVFRQPTDDELSQDARRAYSPNKHHCSEAEYIKRRQRNRGGYRKKQYVVGLTNMGYIDIDSPTTTTLGKLPTQDNVHEALKGYWHYIHPSASRAEGKLRVLYRRNLTVFRDGCFNPDGFEWDIGAVPHEDTQLTQVNAVTDDKTLIDIDPDRTIIEVIEYILTKEMEAFKRLLDVSGINSSGIDTTSAQAHMHSKHLTNTGDDVAEERFSFTGKELVSWS